MSFDIAASLRRIKPERLDALHRRPDDDLPFVGTPATAGPALLLDTTVYVDTLHGRLPDAVKALLAIRRIEHSSIAVAEMTHALGRLSSIHPGTDAAIRAIRRTIDYIPAHRLTSPSLRATAEAGLLSGVVARLRGLPAGSGNPLLNDALLLLQALEQGCQLLTRNIGDMDHLQQAMPMGRVLFYRKR